MGYAFINKTQATGLSTSAVGDKPASTADGHLAVAVLAYAAGTTITPPAGWTSRAKSTSAGVGSVEVFSHIAASDGANYTFTLSTSGSWIIEVLSYSGIDQTTPYDTSSTNNAGSGTTLTGSAVTIAQPNELLMFIAAAFVPGTTYSGLSAGMTARETSNMEVADQQIAASGLTGIRQVTGSGSSPWATVMIAFKGAAFTLTVSGTMASAGGLAKQDNKINSGVMASAGLLIKRVNKVFAGTLTSSGAEANTKVSLLSLAGTLPSSGALKEQVNKITSGVMASTGLLIKKCNKILAGALTSNGTLANIKTAILSIAGTLTSSGLLQKRDNKITGGTMPSSGLLQKQDNKGLGGTLPSSGGLLKRCNKVLIGVLASIGSLVKRDNTAMGGTLPSSGSLAKQDHKELGGTFPSGGALNTVKTALLTVSGTLPSAGALRKQTNKWMDGSLTPAGGLAKRVSKWFGGLLSGLGDLVAQKTGGQVFAGFRVEGQQELVNPFAREQQAVIYIDAQTAIYYWSQDIDKLEVKVIELTLFGVEIP